MNIPLEELRKNNPDEEYIDGYRAVYFYDNHYSVGTYCKTINIFVDCLFFYYNDCSLLLCVLLLSLIE